MLPVEIWLVWVLAPCSRDDSSCPSTSHRAHGLGRHRRNGTVVAAWISNGQRSQSRSTEWQHELLRKISETKLVNSNGQEWTQKTQGVSFEILIKHTQELQPRYIVAQMCSMIENNMHVFKILLKTYICIMQQGKLNSSKFSHHNQPPFAAPNFQIARHGLDHLSSSRDALTLWSKIRSTQSFHTQTDWLDWTGLDWTGLDRTGLDWLTVSSVSFGSVVIVVFCSPQQAATLMCTWIHICGSNVLAFWQWWLFAWWC